MNLEIKAKLHALALKRSLPFCYNDYVECIEGKCPKCGSDDLMRILPGVGCEYGTEWIIKSILESELEPVDLESQFEESVRQCYSETTTVGWMELDTVSVMKSQDPVSWNCAQSEWGSQEAEEGRIISFDNGGSYYWVSEVEELADGE